MSRRIIQKQTPSRSLDKRKTLDAEQLRLEYHFDHGINFKDRVIQITGEIERSNFDMLDSALSELERESRKAITLRINSPGGEVYEALAMIGRLRRSPCQIITEGYGHVMSAATLILASGDKRKLSKYSIVMHHEASYGISGTHSDVREEIEQMEREEKLWASWMEEFTGKEAEFWRQKAHKKNFYLTAQECLDLGIIDSII